MTDYSSYCYHVWILYTGIREVYEYCEKCDKKREPPEEKELDYDFYD